MKSRQLIIDGQLFQTAAWHRGMGKYTLHLIQSLSADMSDIAIILNTAIECNDSRYKDLERLCPDVRLVYAELPLPEGDIKNNDDYKGALEAVIENEFDEREKIYLSTSLFTFDFCFALPANCFNMLIFYDLTPLLFWRDLGGFFPPEQYFTRFAFLYDVDLIVAISETTRQDLLKVFGIKPEKIFNINGGFSKIAAISSRPQHLDLTKKYILFPTGDLPHKNNAVAAEGFAKFIESSSDQYQLIITSTFSESSREKLLSLCPDITFSGNVSDEELLWLYEHAAAVLFASKYEGLGIPILDAAASKKPIISSDISVFREMTKSAFYSFNPSDSDDLASQITKAVTGRTFASKSKFYERIMDKYSWRQTGLSFREAIATYPQEHRQEIRSESVELPRIAVAGFHPGIPDSLSRIAEPLFYHLREHFVVDYYFDSNGYHYSEIERPTYLDFQDCTVSDISKLTAKSHKTYQIVVYLQDNLVFPSRLAQRSVVMPGYLVHDFEPEKLDSVQRLFCELVTDLHDGKTLGTIAGQVDTCEAITKSIIDRIQS